MVVWLVDDLENLTPITDQSLRSGLFMGAWCSQQLASRSLADSGQIKGRQAVWAKIWFNSRGSRGSCVVQLR